VQGFDDTLQNIVEKMKKNEDNYEKKDDIVNG